MNKPLRLSRARWSYFYGRRRLLGTVLGCAALAVLGTASVSACSSTSPPTTPPSFSPGETSPATPTSPGETSPATPTGSASDTPSTASSSGTPSTTSPSTTTPSTATPSALRRAPLRPVLARRRHRARRLTRSPPRPRPPAAAGRPGSSTSCCSASAHWRSWPVPAASPTGERPCGTADTWPRPGLASGRGEDAARLLHQHRHLVRDRVEVGGGGGEHGEA